MIALNFQNNKTLDSTSKVNENIENPSILNNISIFIFGF
jgi:hypothetical protein